MLPSDDGADGASVTPGEREGQSDEVIRTRSYVAEDQPFENVNAVPVERPVGWEIFAVERVDRGQVHPDEADSF